MTRGHGNANANKIYLRCKYTPRNTTTIGGFYYFLKIRIVQVQGTKKIEDLTFIYPFHCAICLLFCPFHIDTTMSRCNHYFFLYHKMIARMDINVRRMFS